MKFKREIEKKFVVSNYGTYSLLRNYLGSLLNVKRMEKGESRDTFWKHEGVDFVRLRENTRELTVKVTDKKDIVDRVEENLTVPSYDAAYVWGTAVWGDPAGTLTKAYTVFYTDNAVVSVYYIIGDKYERMFLEVEATTLDVVNEVSAHLEECISMKQEYRSLFSIFFEPNVAQLRKAN